MHHTQLMPHHLFLPGTAWGILAFVGQRTNGFMFFDGVVTVGEAKKLSEAINDEWHDLSWWFQFHLGIAPDDTTEHFLLGNGWQRRVRVAEAFFRGGGFRIVPESDGVLLLRMDEQVAEFAKDGLLFNNGSILRWPDDETGVVLLFDSKGEVVKEWQEDSGEYSELMDVFKKFPGRHDIVQRPWRQIVRFHEGQFE